MGEVVNKFGSARPDSTVLGEVYYYAQQAVSQ